MRGLGSLPIRSFLGSKGWMGQTQGCPLKSHLGADVLSKAPGSAVSSGRHHHLGRGEKLLLNPAV